MAAVAAAQASSPLTSSRLAPTRCISLPVKGEMKIIGSVIGRIRAPAAITE